MLDELLELVAPEEELVDEVEVEADDDEVVAPLGVPEPDEDEDARVELPDDPDDELFVVDAVEEVLPDSVPLLELEVEAPLDDELPVDVDTAVGGSHVP